MTVSGLVYFRHTGKEVSNLRVLDFPDPVTYPVYVGA